MAGSTMKDYSSFLDDKPFPCDAAGCSMTFTNEDHLTVHKKKHEMVLNLGLGPKGNLYADQTPTPTRFIQNCEELGLFQDLQNVNPFEETFRKAAEAVKAGQTPSLDRTFPPNPPDDTLHTPNVFPHITDFPCINDSENCIPTKIVDNFKKKEKEEVADETSELCKSMLSCTDIGEKILTPTVAIGNLGHNKQSNDIKEKTVILEVPDVHLVQLFSPNSQKTESNYNMVVLDNSVKLDNSTHTSIKEKLKKSINNKSSEVLPLKVPIPKAPTIKTNTSIVNKFSTFSKNSMKFISQIEGSGTDIFDVGLNLKRRKKKEVKFLRNESRSEFLARNRAAATRCREKKKMYVSYLEKLNRELTATNQNLQILNSSLRKQVSNLHAELLRHRNCSIADSKTENALSAKLCDIKEDTKVVHKKVRTVDSKRETEMTDTTLYRKEVKESISNVSLSADQQTVVYDFVEVTLSGNEDTDCQIPLNETNNTDIIVHYNNSRTDLDDHFSSNFSEFKDVVGIQQVLDEHCYFNKHEFDFDVSRKMINYDVFKTQVKTPVTNVDYECNKSNDENEEKILAASTVLLNSRTPPPLILLKPFKKRTLMPKPIEKS